MERPYLAGAADSSSFATMTFCATVILPQADAPHSDDTIPGTPTDTPEGNSNEASPPNGVTEEYSMLPNLETFIPAECLPDVIDVYIDEHFMYSICGPRSSHIQKLSSLRKHPVRKPIKFMRQYPVCTHADEGDVNGSNPSVDVPDRDCPKRKVLTGQLDLRHYNLLGEGNHSKVVLAPLTVPSSPLPHAVAVKFSTPYSDPEMLSNEAKIYNAFPRNLQDGDIPVVPKFYGYYAPYIEALEWYASENDSDGDDLEEKKWKVVKDALLKSTHTSILLVEACGEEVKAHSLSLAARQDIAKLMDRLHDANFIQGSFYERNILVQPGPLTLPRAVRSLDTPSYRIIDFGRGQSLGLNDSSLESMRIKAKDERRRAGDKNLIPW